MELALRFYPGDKKAESGQKVVVERCCQEVWGDKASKRQPSELQEGFDETQGFLQGIRHIPFL